jgi:hypothetical protein
VELLFHRLEDESNAEQMDHIIFCAFAEVDLHIYEHMLSVFFPRSTGEP